MVQHEPSSRSLKRSFNQEVTQNVGGQSVYTVDSNNDFMKRQKCHLEEVQKEEELGKTSASSPKQSCISLEALKAHLECPVCLIVPKMGPIYQCRNGHLLCRDCHPKMKRCPLCQIGLEKNLRNLLSEQLVSMIYPEYQFSIDRSTRTREPIWHGKLLWRENLRPAMNNPNSGQRVERNINLSITTAIENGVPEVVPVNWPSSLVMQTIPISLINRTGKEFFSNSRTVVFHPNEEESLESLTNLLGNHGGANAATGLAGCVHFSSVPNCDVKVLILLYSREKKVFLGFIPNDQNTFVERIREEIRKEKSKRDHLANVNDQLNNATQQQQQEQHSVLQQS